MLSANFTPPLEAINDSLLEQFGLHLYVLRIDVNHPEISGNKLYKLKYNLLEAKQQNKNSVLTFGGAYSNHIAATAAAGKELGFKTIGIIRGDALEKLNPTLKLALENGMKLKYVSREEYKKRNDPDLLNQLREQFGHPYIIPEGGANKLGIEGCKEIINSITIPFDAICCACGTGTTFAGIILSLRKEQKAIGFQVQKAEGYMEKEVGSWLNSFDHHSRNWEIKEDYHFGGYAKRTSQLIDFASRFEKENNIPLDHVYTAKMMFGIYDLIKKRHFKAGQTIIAIHTGGLQGNKGFEK